MKFFRLLFGALGVLLVLILVADLSKPKPKGTSTAEPKFVPAVPSERREYEARERLQPLIESILNEEHQRSTDRTAPAVAAPARPTPAEEQAARDRHYRELLMTPGPIYEPKESPGR